MKTTHISFCIYICFKCVLSIIPKVTITPQFTARILENTEQQFTCSITVQTNWRSVLFFDSTNHVATFINRDGCKFFPLSSDFQDLYEINCGATPGQFFFTIKQVTKKHNNQKVKCIVQYGDGGDSDISVTDSSVIIVIIPLTSISIFPDTTSINIERGSSEYFMCSATSRPVTEILWRKARNGQIIENITSTKEQLNETMVESYLKYTGNEADEGADIFCIGQYKGTNMESKKVRLRIIYIPDNNPVIVQEPAGGIIAGNNVTLQCIVSGGNPLAKLSWNCQGRKINSTKDSTSSYSVEITVDKTYNNRKCICSATHLLPSYRQSMSQTLTVFYIPEGNLSIQQMPNHGIIDRHEVNLTCSVQGGNPLAILSWDCKGNTTNSTTATTSSYSVEFIVDRNDNNRFCICAATHLISSYRPNIQHTLVVFFKPFLDNTRPYSPSHISTTENNKLQITLTITANPTPTIEWTFKAEADWDPCNLSSIVSNTTTNGFITSSSILIDKVHSSNFGDYTFTANNTVGIFFRRFVVIEEASAKQETCAHTQEITGIIIVGIVTLVIGLLSLMASVIFIARNSFKNKTLKSSKSDEYTGVQRVNPAFTDEYTTLQSEIELKPTQEQSSNTYEECGRKKKEQPYSNVNAKGSESNHPQEHGNTYEECGRNVQAHAYDTLDK